MSETYEKSPATAVESKDASANSTSNKMAISVSGAWSMARLVLVNDYDGQGAPVFSFSAKQV